MGALEALVRGLTWLFCGPKAPEPLPDGASQEVYVPPTVPHKPGQGQGQSRPPVSTPPSYQSRPDAPPATQPQQWQQQRPEHRHEHQGHHAQSPSAGTGRVVSLDFLGTMGGC